MRESGGPAAQVALDVEAVLGLDAAAAQALAAVVGVGRATAGRPGSEQRAALAAALAATLLRRLARAGGVANRLRVTTEPGPSTGEVTLRWPVTGAADEALAAAAVRLASWLGRPPDDGGLRAALRAEGARVAGG